MKSYRENMEFEAEVRRTAEVVWQLEPGACQPEHYDANTTIRELDGLARLRDITHVLMATTSTKLAKVKDDVHKLNAAEVIEKRQGVPVAKWLITEQQLQAEHVAHATKHGVTALTLAQFRSRFFDGR